MRVEKLLYRHDKESPYFFKDLSFELKPNALNALLGKNGAGKSVLLNILSGKIPSQAKMSGQIVGMRGATLVNQRFDEMIAPQFSFHENLQFACMKAYPTPFARLTSPTFSPSFLQRFDIDHKKPAHLLSGGQRQILALLMVLQKPQNILLLDEPTATLDEQNALLVFDFLTTLTTQNVTLLVVCHDTKLLHHHTTGLTLHLETHPSGLRTAVINSP